MSGEHGGSARCGRTSVGVLEHRHSTGDRGGTSWATSAVYSSETMLLTARSVPGSARNRSLNRPAKIVAMYPGRSCPRACRGAITVAERVRGEEPWSSTAMMSSTSTEPQPEPLAVAAFGPRIDWPHDVSRPLLPRGLHITTTNPAAACICASSKNTSPYWVNGPPWTLSNTGYRVASAKSRGRMIQASTSSLPSWHGTVNFSQSSHVFVTVVTWPSSVHSSAGRCTQSIRPSPPRRLRRRSLGPRADPW